MSVFEAIRSQFVPIHREGYPFIALFALVTVVVFWLLAPLGVIAAVLTVWCVWFFRDPPRVTPLRDGIVVAPADGQVCGVVRAAPPRELGLGEGAVTRISIFMSVFDCHVNRSPIAGRIEKIVYKAGAFISADLDKASESNERNSFIIASAHGRLVVVQIAGLVARRIVCFARQGATIGAGERIGMIRFGSRLDVYLPADAQALVTEGQTAIAGETVIADLAGGTAELTFRVN
ncbi:MAG TPA: phosphatidylserine decarboxylase [Xanthobacteraceae bacterium]|jgi:phosphatidylserine decarboxylase